ncbi:hypothetical protein H0H92_009336 [Tricholoma furcatifolium]|nr:hypothetical protein H0H92_009336 [Tricholoma furcatifolium]
MAMSLKAELETWAAALKAYDEEDFEKSLDLFSRIADSSKILTNMGLIYATLGEHEAAVKHFIEATDLDQYLAVASVCKCGVSNFLLTRYDLAFKDFEEAFLYLRGNQDINYEQLGLKFRLFSAEVLFNRGLSQVYLGRMQEGLADMEEARREKATEEHNVIDDAIQDRGEGYTVFSIPVGVLYRPSEKKLKNAVTKDYMGKAKLVAASDPGDAFTTFTGVTRLKQGVSPSGVFVDRLDLDTSTAQSNIGRSATVPAPRTAGDEPPPRSAVLERSKTTLNVPPNARQLTSGQGASPTSPQAPPNTAPVRSNTVIGTNSAPAPSMNSAPVRGLSIKRPAPPVAKEPDNRITDFYDEYLDPYNEGNAPPPPPIRSAGAPAAPPDRVAAWAQSNANSNFAPTRSGSRSAPASNYAPSSFGGGTLRRKVTRRPTVRSRGPSTYEEEEGYASGDYDDAPFELVKIRIKLHYQDDVRGMTLNPDTPFEEFLDKVTSKFGKGINGLDLKFKDEDGGRVSLKDDSDYELAIETARESSKGKPEGKLEICTITDPKNYSPCFERNEMGLSGRRVKQRIPADPRNLAWADDAAKFGSNYLSKFGWDASKGLGVEGDGRTSHIKVTQKLDMLGIGAAHQKDPNGIAWKQNKDFENLLKRLNENIQAESSPEEAVVEIEENTLVEASETPDEDGKEKKRKRKEKREKSAEKAKKRRKKDIEDEKDTVDARESLAVETKADEQTTATKPFVPRNRAHRARAIASKAIASKSSAHIAEILGIAPTPSTSAEASGSGTPIGGQLTSLDDTVSLEQLTTSTKSVADYFKEKLLAKSSKSGTQTPSTPLPDTQENDSYDTPRGGLGASRMLSIQADEADAEVQRVGLSKFSSLMSSTFLSATTLLSTIDPSTEDSTPTSSDTPKVKEKRKKELADGNVEEERRSKKEKKKRRKAEDGESEEAAKDGDETESVVSRKKKKDKRLKDTEAEKETAEEEKALSKEERRRLRKEKKDRKESSL